MHRSTAALLTGLVVALAACSDESPTPVAPEASTAPQLAADRAGRAIPDQYIVVLKEGASPRAAAAAIGANPRFVYQVVLNGFAAKLNAAQIAALRNNPQVDYIAQDRVVTVSATQYSPTWGLDRIDQRYLPLSNSYTYNATGAGVNVYILDSGIRTSHSEFGGRARVGYDVIGDGYNGQDCIGHGTHVAGTVGGSTYGVAKGVNLISVRVIDCYREGAISGVIKGVEWVTDNHVKPAVANMSLGYPVSTSTDPLDQAVQKSINRGVTYTISAANSNALACNRSPARVKAALTVGATTSADARASYSNYGSCLDIFAPGSDVTSAWHQSNTETNTISGTSMAAPHVAGVAALYLQSNPAATPPQVWNALVYNATAENLVADAGIGSPNRLLYSRLSPPPPLNPLRVQMYCGSDRYCEAYASGGTGSMFEFVFTWTNARETVWNGNNSLASVTCSSPGTITVGVKVMDASGATASASTPYTCS